MTALNNVQQLNEYVESYVEDFFTSLEANGSSHTESQYKGGIEEFIKAQFGYELKFLTVTDLSKVSIDMIIKYFNDMYKLKDENDEKLYMNSTINGKLSAIKRFIKYMNFRKVIDFEVALLDEIKGFKTDSVSHETMPMHIVELVIEDIRKNESRLSVEKEWFIKTAVETGLRAKDVLNLEQKQFTVLPNGRDVMIKSIGSNRGKGNKDWKEIVDIEFYNELKEALFKGDRENLFTISQSTVAKMIHRSQERLGIDRGYTPHSLKRTAVNNTRRTTGSREAAQIKGKHSNPSTTDIYLDEIDYGATGYYSMMNRTNLNLINEVSHDDLLTALNELGEDVKLMINTKLQEKLNK